VKASLDERIIACLRQHGPMTADEMWLHIGGPAELYEYLLGMWNDRKIGRERNSNGQYIFAALPRNPRPKKDPFDPIE
jgi:hypothetical protein